MGSPEILSVKGPTKIVDSWTDVRFAYPHLDARRNFMKLARTRSKANPGKFVVYYRRDADYRLQYRATFKNGKIIREWTPELGDIPERLDDEVSDEVERLGIKNKYGADNRLSRRAWATVLESVRLRRMARRKG